MRRWPTSTRSAAPAGTNNYPWGWTVAGNTPFRRWKREVHEGGVADPLIVHWPSGGAEGGAGFRRQYVHAIDIVPTVLDAVGIEPPEEIRGVTQRPIEGTSFFASLYDPASPDTHITQYYEMFGCRALYHEGWKAVTYHPIMQTEPGIDADAWELYHVAVDPSECHDLAGRNRNAWRRWSGAGGSKPAATRCFPSTRRPLPVLVTERPLSVPHRQRYDYYQDAAPVPELVAVNVKNRTHRIVAEVTIPEGGAQGVLLSQGSLLGGWTFYVAGGALHYVHNRAATAPITCVADCASTRALIPSPSSTPRSASTGDGCASRPTARSWPRGRSTSSHPAGSR